MKWILLTILTVIWGSSFVLIKEGLLTFSPIEVAGLRMIFASSVLLPFIFRSVAKIPAGKWKWLLASGMVGNCIPAVLFTLAESRINSTTAGMLNALSPLFTLLIAFAVFKNKTRSNQWLGVLIGMLGALALIYFQPKGDKFIADPYAWYVVLACVGYGASVNIIRNHFGGLSVMHAAGFALSFAAIPYVIYFLIHPVAHKISFEGTGLRSLLAVAALGMVGSSVATVLFNSLVKKSSALFAASVTYLMPFVSVVLGIWYGEIVNMAQLISLALILGGVYIISRKPKEQAR
ncbi:MAG: EamA family transporter [Bacteroidetes bacterium]|nr:EamA family transporter [Bacteroidota bacterium]